MLDRAVESDRVGDFSAPRSGTGRTMITSSTGIDRMPRLIAARELAALLQVSMRTLWRWRSTGRVIQPIRIGGATRWRLEEVESWISQGCPSPMGDQQ